MDINRKLPIIFCLILFLFGSDYTFAQNSGKWVRPLNDGNSEPMWGHRHGIRVGIAPTPGPRGLLRIFTP